MRRWALSALLFAAGCQPETSAPPDPVTAPLPRSWKRPGVGSETATASASAVPAETANEVASAAVASATASTSASARPEPRHRRGLWIWEFGKNAPLAPRAAELAQTWGVHRVFIKASNGNLGPRWAKNASPENIAAFSERGIEVWLFGYFYSPDIADADGRTWGSIDEQVKMMLAAAKAPGVTGVIVDAEEEFKDRPAEAKELCVKLRAGLKGKKLGYTTFGWLKPNKKFPYATFDRYCGDVFMPQVYWAFGWPGGIDGSLARLRDDLAAMKLSAPVWEVQSNEKDPSAASLGEFFEKTSPDASIFYFFPEGSPQTKKLGRLRFR
jgi:hypothetical protein